MRERERERGFFQKAAGIKRSWDTQPRVGLHKRKIAKEKGFACCSWSLQYLIEMLHVHTRRTVLHMLNLRNLAPC